MTEKKTKHKDFESALARLEEITDKLETGEARLDEAISLYSEGIETVNFCNKKLNEIEKKILILKEQNKELVEVDFDQGEEDGD